MQITDTIADMLTRIRNANSAKHESVDIPASNVLRFFLEDGSWFSIRPSGTEPKIKFYFYTKQDSAQKAKEVNLAIKEDIMNMITKVE